MGASLWFSDLDIPESNSGHAPECNVKRTCLLLAGLASCCWVCVTKWITALPHVNMLTLAMTSCHPEDIWWFQFQFPSLEGTTARVASPFLVFSRAFSDSGHFFFHNTIFSLLCRLYKQLWVKQGATQCFQAFWFSFTFFERTCRGIGLPLLPFKTASQKSVWFSG